MTLFRVEYEFRGLDVTTRAVWRRVIFLSVVLLNLKTRSPFNSNVLDLAATLFTPETPEVFSGLSHFPHPFIGIVVSR